MYTPPLNLQIVPFDGVWPLADPPPRDLRLWVVPARDDQEGQVQPCPVCGGTGRLPRGEECRKCGGAGRARFVQCLRWTVREKDRPVAAALLDALAAQQPRVQVTVELHEQGGGSTNTGWAQIVSGLRGEPLPAVYGRAICNGAHAVFYVHAALVVEYSHHRGRGRGTVTLVGVDRSAPHRLGVEVVPLWAFTDECDAAGFEVLAPEYLGRNAASDSDTLLVPPEAAIAAAREKAHIYHCRSAVYAASGGAHGPSGALRGAGAAYGGLPSPFKGPGIGYRPAN
jgi:hypothetical protein